MQHYQIRWRLRHDHYWHRVARPFMSLAEAQAAADQLIESGVCLPPLGSKYFHTDTVCQIRRTEGREETAEPWGSHTCAMPY